MWGGGGGGQKKTEETPYKFGLRNGRKAGTSAGKKLGTRRRVPLYSRGFCRIKK